MKLHYFYLFIANGQNDYTMTRRWWEPSAGDSSDAGAASSAKVHALARRLAEEDNLAEVVSRGWLPPCKVVSPLGGGGLLEGGIRHDGAGPRQVPPLRCRRALRRVRLAQSLSSPGTGDDFRG